MEPANLSAEIDLDLRNADSAWQAELLFRAGGDAGSLPIEELRVVGDSVFLRTTIEGADMRFSLALADELLLGSVRISENEQVLAEGPVGLARADDSRGRAEVTRWLDEQGASIDAAGRSAAIEQATRLLVANYVFPDVAERAAADVRERAERGEYDTINSPARFAEALSRRLVERTGDRHVQVKFGGEPVGDPTADDEVEETPAEVAAARRDAEAEHFGIGEPRILDGNVGYLPFERFVRAEFAGDALAAAMQRLSDTDALIVDLRESHGGDPVMVALTASWFFEGRPRHWNDLVRRADGNTIQFWTAAWLPGPRYVDRPVYILTSKATFSAPESFAYEMQQTGRATVVGEATGGGAHPGAWFPMDGGFSIFIPRSRYVSAASGGDWEATGVEPDVTCDAAQALECARKLALQALGPAPGAPAGPPATTHPAPGDEHMELGNFSVGLAVKDIAASRAFYEKLGFRQVFGDEKQNWLILQNSTSTIGLFQGAQYTRNMLTFNPGWDRSGGTLPEFDDVREIQRMLEDRGIAPTVSTDPSSTGPASIVLADPDGNPIIIDQHVPRPER